MKTQLSLRITWKYFIYQREKKTKKGETGQNPADILGFMRKVTVSGCII